MSILHMARLSTTLTVLSSCPASGHGLGAQAVGSFQESGARSGTLGRCDTSRPKGRRLVAGPCLSLVGSVLWAPNLVCGIEFVCVQVQIRGPYYWPLIWIGEIWPNTAAFAISVIPLVLLHLFLDASLSLLEYAGAASEETLHGQRWSKWAADPYKVLEQYVYGTGTGLNS